MKRNWIPVVCTAAVLANAISLRAEVPAGDRGNTIDRDLMEISVPGLEHLYGTHRYTVTQVTQWYLDRIGRYDGTYRAMLSVDREGALRRAAEEDAELKGTKHGELWGVPILIKANTSVKGCD